MIISSQIEEVGDTDMSSMGPLVLSPEQSRMLCERLVTVHSNLGSW